MDFFSDSNVMDLAEFHATKILGLEESLSTKIIDSYKRVRHELRDRLDSLPSGSFTAQRVRSVLVQVDAALDSMNTGLLDNMDNASGSAAEMGASHLIDEIRKWDKHFTGAAQPINLDVVTLEADNSTFLFNHRELYKSGMTAYSAQLRGRMAQGLMDASVEQLPMGEVVQRLSKTFLGEEWKLQRIVRTELHNVYSSVKLNSMSKLAEDDIPDLRKTLYNPLDSRTADDSKYEESLHLVVPVDEPFEYTWKGKVRRFQAPPDRPNDRQILIPYREAWGRK